MNTPRLTSRLVVALACAATLTPLPRALWAADPAAKPVTQPAPDPKLSAAASNKMSFLSGNIMGSPGPSNTARLTTTPDKVAARNAIENPVPLAPAASPIGSPFLGTDTGDLTKTVPSQTPSPANTFGGDSHNVAPPGYVDHSADDAAERRTVRYKMADVVEPIQIENATAKQAFEWFSQTTGVPVIINWDSLTRQNIDPDTKINLTLRSARAGKLLGLIMQQTSPDISLIFEQTSDYVQIMTKADANKDMVVEMYEIGDLVDEPYDASVNAPKFDLASAISTSTGSGSSSTSAITGASTVFGGGTQEKRKSKAQRVEELLNLIRDSVEPEIWSSAGGPATIKYFNGQLIVKAPRYVQAQIGYPSSKEREHSQFFISQASPDH